MEEVEMTCAAQAVEILEKEIKEGDSLLDIGCGTGYLYHSFAKRKLKVDYYGIDAEEEFISMGRKYLPQYGLPEDHLMTMRVEDLNAEVDHVVCMNVLTNIDNYHKPLERILKSARKSLVLRESISDISKYLYVTDKYLNDGVSLKVYVNTYSQKEIIDFIKSFGFSVEVIVDKRSQGKPEMVIDYPHFWKFIFAKRIKI
jgi:ubiquinone/menaquinone biosynthesis C-methylase UbiE